MTVEVLVATVAHDLADARIHRLVAALVDVGLDVSIAGTGDLAGAPAGVHVTSLGNRRSLPSRPLAAARLLGQRARVLLVVDPDLAIVGRLWRRLHRGRLVVDVHEDYAAVLADRSWIRPSTRRLVAALARAAERAAAAADLTLVADDHVPPAAARRRVVVRNVPSSTWLPDPDAPRDARPRAIHVGDLRTSRGLDDMVAAVAAAPGWILDLVGQVGDAERDRVLAGAGQAADRIRFHGRLAPVPSWELARGAWVGLSMLHDTPAFRAAMPTKIHEFLGSGLPVLSTPLPRVAELLSRSGAGVVVAGPEDAARTLRAWTDDTSELDDLRDSARAWARSASDGPSPFAAAAAEVAALLMNP